MDMLITTTLLILLHKIVLGKTKFKCCSTENLKQREKLSNIQQSTATDQTSTVETNNLWNYCKVV